MSGAEAKIRGVVARAEGPNPQHGKAAVDLISAELSGIRQEAAAAAEHRWLLSLQSWDVVTAFRVAIRQKGLAVSFGFPCIERSDSLPSGERMRTAIVSVQIEERNWNRLRWIELELGSRVGHQMGQRPGFIMN